jgi:hypothetical protein
MSIPADGRENQPDEVQDHAGQYRGEERREMGVLGHENELAD